MEKWIQSIILFLLSGVNFTSLIANLRHGEMSIVGILLAIGSFSFMLFYMFFGYEILKIAMKEDIAEQNKKYNNR